MLSTTGGLDLKGQEAALRKSPDIIIATPGRLLDHLHNTPSFTLNDLEILILDEADRWNSNYHIAGNWEGNIFFKIDGF